MPIRVCSVANSSGEPVVDILNAEKRLRIQDFGDISAAMARLADSHARYQRHNAPTKNIYYPPNRKHRHEQSLDYLVASGALDGVITRNHYGSVVLNARRALFIDVDMPDAGDQEEAHHSGSPLDQMWRTTYEDLRTVLSSESDSGFRIYRTAAGFRVLAVTQEFEPGSEVASHLMAVVGADDAFVRLCGSQKTFRARLTPKPWRCGATRPPNDFPRLTAADQDDFTAWLRNYERLCENRATCQFLGEVGSSDVHERVAPIVEFHDRHTRAFTALELA
jgi:hypothetical protein